MAYERSVKEKKMEKEVNAARVEAHHFRDLADKADGDQVARRKGKDLKRKEWQFYQKQTEAEIKDIIAKKGTTGEGGKKGLKAGKRKRDGAGAGVELSKKDLKEEKKAKKRQLLQSIFQGGTSDE